MKHKFIFSFAFLFAANFLFAADSEEVGAPESRGFFAYYRDSAWNYLGLRAEQFALSAIDQAYLATANTIADLVADAVNKAVYDFSYSNNTSYTEYNGQKLKHYYYEPNLLKNLLGKDANEIVKELTGDAPFIGSAAGKLAKMLENYVASKVLPKFAEERVRQLTLEALLYAKGYSDGLIRKEIKKIFNPDSTQNVTVVAEPKEKKEQEALAEIAQDFGSFKWNDQQIIKLSDLIAVKIVNPIIETINTKVEQAITDVIRDNAESLGKNATTSLSYYISNALIVAPVLYIVATGGVATPVAIGMMGAGMFMFRNEQQIASIAGKNAVKAAEPLGRVVSAPLKLARREVNEFHHVLVEDDFVELKPIDYSFRAYVTQFLPAFLVKRNAKDDDKEIDLTKSLTASYVKLKSDNNVLDGFERSMVLVKVENGELSASALAKSFVAVDYGMDDEMFDSAVVVEREEPTLNTKLTREAVEGINELFGSAVIVPRANEVKLVVNLQETDDELSTIDSDDSNDTLDDDDSQITIEPEAQGHQDKKKSRFSRIIDTVIDGILSFLGDLHAAFFQFYSGA